MTKKQQEKMIAALDAVTNACMASADCKGCPAKIGLADCVRLAVWSTNKHQRDMVKYLDADQRQKEPCRERFEGAKK